MGEQVAFAVPTDAAVTGGVVSVGGEFWTVDDGGVVSRRVAAAVCWTGPEFDRDVRLVCRRTGEAVRAAGCYATEAAARANAVQYARFRLETLESELAHFRAVVAGEADSAIVVAG